MVCSHCTHVQNSGGYLCTVSCCVAVAYNSFVLLSEARDANIKDPNNEFISRMEDVASVQTRRGCFQHIKILQGKVEPCRVVRRLLVGSDIGVVFLFRELGETADFIGGSEHENTGTTIGYSGAPRGISAVNLYCIKEEATFSGIFLTAATDGVCACAFRSTYLQYLTF